MRTFLSALAVGVILAALWLSCSAAGFGTSGSSGGGGSGGLPETPLSQAHGGTGTTSLLSLTTLGTSGLASLNSLSVTNNATIGGRLNTFVLNSGKSAGDTFAMMSDVGAGGGANTGLSNLASVSINQSLIAGADNSIDLGSATNRWANLYVGTLANMSSLSVGSINTFNLNSAKSAGDTFAMMSDVGAGGGANTGLSNLASVSINQSLIAGAHNSIDLGSSSLAWRNLYVASLGTFGSLTVSANTTLGGALTTTGLATLSNVTVSGSITAGHFVGDGSGLSNLPGGNAIYAGQAQMTGGSGSAACTHTTANSIIILTPADLTGYLGYTPRVTAQTAGVGFTFAESNLSQTVKVNWILIEPNNP